MGKVTDCKCPCDHASASIHRPYLGLKEWQMAGQIGRIHAVCLVWNTVKFLISSHYEHTYRQTATVKCSRFFISSHTTMSHTRQTACNAPSNYPKNHLEKLESGIVNCDKWWKLLVAATSCFYWYKPLFFFFICILQKIQKLTNNFKIWYNARCLYAELRWCGNGLRGLEVQIWVFSL